MPRSPFDSARCRSRTSVGDRFWRAHYWTSGDVAAAVAQAAEHGARLSIGPEGLAEYATRAAAYRAALVECRATTLDGLAAQIAWLRDVLDDPPSPPLAASEVDRLLANALDALDLLAAREPAERPAKPAGKTNA